MADQNAPLGELVDPVRRDVPALRRDDPTVEGDAGLSEPTIPGHEIDAANVRPVQVGCRSHGDLGIDVDGDDRPLLPDQLAHQGGV